MKKSNFWKSYGFLILMLTGIVAGCVVGAIWPAVMEVVDGETIIVDKGATVLEPLGTVFLNLMFCIAVPTVFCSISSSIANMQSAKRAGQSGRGAFVERLRDGVEQDKVVACAVHLGKSHRASLLCASAGIICCAETKVNAKSC